MDWAGVWGDLGTAIAGISPLFKFAHGLAFFVLGMTILLVAPRAGRLEMARRLPLLSLFAFCEAAVAWDSTLASSISPEHVVPPLLQTILLGLGYGTLLTFGLLAPVPPDRRVRARVALPILPLALWLLLLLLPLNDIPTAQAAFWGGVIVRYGAALPGGLLARRGLRRETYRSMDPQILRLTEGSLRVAETALGTFGVVAGMILPSISLLTSGPVARQAAEVLSLILTFCGIALTYGLMRTLNVIRWEVERWIEGVEHSMALAADRERIGRELHDGIIQSIYAAGLMLEGVRQSLQEDPAAAETLLSRAMDSLNQTIQDIRRYIFDLRGQEPEADLVTGLEALLRDFRVNTLLETSLIVRGEDTHSLDIERQRHIFQVAREALSNVARHAQARRVEIRLIYQPDRLQLQIADDGVGLTIIPTARGQGLRNARERARLLDGTLDIDSAPGQGVTLTLTVPYSKGETV
ncbi:MAG TPA: sensor histidine kinase [Anaerolineales bacterium]|nr:sensor histidine kinase [Anaerolineae bacterium]HIQ00993.1 sensor histidine kinase [Anaerolineales bacterium]